MFLSDNSVKISYGYNMSHTNTISRESKAVFTMEVFRTPKQLTSFSAWPSLSSHIESSRKEALLGSSSIVLIEFESNRTSARFEFDNLVTRLDSIAISEQLSLCGDGY